MNEIKVKFEDLEKLNEKIKRQEEGLDHLYRISEGSIDKYILNIYKTKMLCTITIYELFEKREYCHIVYYVETNSLKVYINKINRSTAQKIRWRKEKMEKIESDKTESLKIWIDNHYLTF